jgi:SulP family sulfate permease
MFFTGFFTNLPEPILASVVLVAVTGLFKREALAHLYHVQRKEFWIALLALLGVLIFGMLEGVLIGVIISLLVLIGRVSQSRLSLLGRVPESLRFDDIREHPDYQTVPGLMLIRIDELLFFANATPISEEIEHLVASSEEPLQAVLIDLELSDELDISSAVMLAELCRGLSENGIQLMLSRVSPEARALLDRSGVSELVGTENIYPRTLAAVAEFLEKQNVALTKVNTLTAVLLIRLGRLYDTLAARASEAEHEELEAFAAELNALAEKLNLPTDDKRENQ